MISKNSLEVGTELAEGSFGNVYTLANPFYRSDAGQRYVYKEYKEYVKPDCDSLSAFVKFYYGLGAEDKAYLDSICCWPHDLVRDESDTSGFLMLQIPEKFFCTINFSGGPKTVEAKFEHLLLPDRLLERRRIALTDKARYKLLLSVVRGLNFFHEHGICVGDFSHSNILFSLRDCSVFFLDCDSFRLNEDTVFAQTETGNWGVTERYPKEEMGTASSDIYKLGLLALRLLMKSDNPSHYQASTNLDRLPARVDACVKFLIEGSLESAPLRPTLAEWSAALHRAIISCISEPAPQPQRATATSTARSVPASQVFNVFPTSAAWPPPPPPPSSSSPPPPSSPQPPPPKVEVQYKQKPNATKPVYQYPDPNARPQKKRGDGFAVASFVLGIAAWLFIFIFLGSLS